MTTATNNYIMQRPFVFKRNSFNRAAGLRSPSETKQKSLAVVGTTLSLIKVNGKREFDMAKRSFKAVQMDKGISPIQLLNSNLLIDPKKRDLLISSRAGNRNDESYKKLMGVFEKTKEVVRRYKNKEMMLIKENFMLKKEVALLRQKLGIDCLLTS
eukprot:TRINITY_DN17167_c0_g1_i1.p1 TRINITY_DN17167_c0_g1~~TRINITY_DN17167_c0_g1_i1.p1  ORF type:complete len:156 (+),score=32.87 TRINITY_DN17167_c0_g1_i1:400-867(+)